MTMKYSLIRNDDSEANLTVVIDGEMFTAVMSHPHFDEILEKVIAGDESVINLLNPSVVAARKFDRLSERVTVANGRVHFDGEQVDNALTEQVVRFINENVEDFKPLVNFFEKIMTNPQEHSREQLFRWLENHQFTITDEGDFLAYKGVKVSNDPEIQYQSISTGKAISNGVEYDGAIPNPLNAVVEMPRSEVQHDPSVGCHTGLHAGTYSYATGFAQGAVLTVRINPRDVVSVPTDCNSQKLRVCRYTVVEVTPSEYKSAYHSYSSPVDDDDDDWYDDEYDDLGY